MPPRLMSLFVSTPTVLSPVGVGIAGWPGGSESGVRLRPTPNPGAQNSWSAPPVTCSSLTVGTDWTAADAGKAIRNIRIDARRARDNGHLRKAVVWGVNNDRCHRASTKRTALAAASPSTLAK